ncbi:MAG TPA: ABC transporter substrate-binding protein, partial [Lachnospiraceae bacterium]|nr:ABC transporter substrate-binding protein [Lachnospiraceae bacterium]HBY71755.1 ABC transporter substrate-binding protein [Lachnospiraceae bacterium]
RDYNFANRFRTGLMPLAIQDYTEYNTLVAFAPEIKGLWSFAPIPGTVGEDGITRAAACNGTCAMILSGAKDPDASWKFLEWWTSTDIQAQFAQEMKSVLGKSAMHATANMEAIRSLPWTKEEYSNLLEQWGYITGTPEIPGGYYVPRNVGFAANVAYGTGEGEVLMDYSKETNEEITRKRAEFGLE